MKVNDPYPISWVNRLAASISGGRLPYWLICLILLILETALLHGVSWFESSFSPPTFDPVFLIIAIWTWGSLALMPYLNEVASAALIKYRDLLNVPDGQSFEQLRFQLTSSPARPVLITNLFFIGVFLFFVFIQPFELLLTFEPLTRSIVIVSGILMYAFGSGFYYHVIHMLIMVDRIYRMSKPFNAFDREPIFAFSELSARSSLAILAFATLNIVFIPPSMIDIGVIFFEITLIPVALFAFVLPLWEAHRRLVDVKQTLQASTEQRIEATMRKVHLSLEAEDADKLEFLNNALATLVIERDIVDKLPTWPWRKGMLTGISSAVLVPLILLVVQIYLQRWL